MQRDFLAEAGILLHAYPLAKANGNDKKLLSLSLPSHLCDGLIKNALGL